MLNSAYTRGMATRTRAPLTVRTGIEAAAAAQRHRFASRNCRVRNSSRVHATAPHEWLAGTNIAAPLCGASPGYVELAALKPTYAPVSCGTCLRKLSRGAMPSAWVAGPQQLTLFEPPVRDSKNTTFGVAWFGYS